MSFCEKAIPYLKASLKHTSASMTLKREDQPVLKPLGNGLIVFYLVDAGNAFKYVQVRHLNQSRLTEAELHERSTENLKARMADQLRIQPYGNVFAILLDGNVESSLLLVDDLWDRRLLHLKNRGFIAAVPARDILAFCDISSHQGIMELHKIVERAQGADHLISPALFQRQGQAWVKYVD
jgi:uncharacterized protein YtpQ (UPF0354 family)